jgi:hypothetical protein
METSKLTNREVLELLNDAPGECVEPVANGFQVSAGLYRAFLESRGAADGQEVTGALQGVVDACVASTVSMAFGSLQDPTATSNEEMRRYVREMLVEAAAAWLTDKAIDKIRQHVLTGRSNRRGDDA